MGTYDTRGGSPISPDVYDPQISRAEESAGEWIDASNLPQRIQVLLYNKLSADESTWNESQTKVLLAVTEALLASAPKAGQVNAGQEELTASDPCKLCGSEFHEQDDCPLTVDAPPTAAPGPAAKCGDKCLMPTDCIKDGCEREAIGCEALTSATPAPSRTEEGWLFERNQRHGEPQARWFKGRTRMAHGDTDYWTLDAHLAKRYPTKEAAEADAKWMFTDKELYPVAPEITGHFFNCGPGSAPSRLAEDKP